MKIIRLTMTSRTGRSHRWLSSVLKTTAGARPAMPFTRGNRPVIAPDMPTPRMVPDLPKAAASRAN